LKVKKYPPLAEKLIKQGKIEGKQELLIKFLRRKFNITHMEENTIRSVADEFKLDATVEAMLDATSKDEVFKILRSTNV
jgi:hypothetical protein